MGVKLAIDLESSTTKIYRLGGGVLLSEPSVVALNAEGDGQIRAIGLDAKRIIGKTADNTRISFPIFEGEVVNEKMAVAMLSYFLKKIQFRPGIGGGSVLVNVPCGLDVAMLKKYERVMDRCGMGEIDFVESPVLCALGQNVPVNESNPCFVIDLGGGVTNIAALSLGGVIAGVSLNVGGNLLDSALIDYIAETFGLQVGLLTAERAKKQVGSLYRNDRLSAVVNGRDVATGKPRSLSLSAKDIHEPVKLFYDKIAEYAFSVIAKLPAEVAAEIRHAGIYLAGGGAEMTGLEDYFGRVFNMKINIPSEPAMSAMLGAGAALGNENLLKAIRLKQE